MGGMRLIQLNLCCLGLAFASGMAGAAANPSGAEHVSIIQLIGTPERFHTKKVLVAGYLQIQFEGNVLYLSREDALVGNSKNGVWIGYGKEVSSKADLADFNAYYERLKPFSGKYVILEGVFDKDSTGHLDCCSGAITAVSRVTPLGIAGQNK